MRDGTTELEMEAYRRRKLAVHDPMAKMMET
jgi:hypothetical protein